MIWAQRLLTLAVLLGTFLWLGSLLVDAFTADGPRPTRTVTSEDTVLPDLPDLPLPPAPDTAALDAVRARPLFIPGRRPPQSGAAPVAAEVAPAAPFAYSLTGVITFDTQTHAILRGPGGTSVRMVRGDVLDGWRLTEIEANRAILERDGERMVLAIGE